MRHFDNIPPLYSSIIQKNFSDAAIRIKRGEKLPEIFYEQMMGKDDIDACQFIWAQQTAVREKLIPLAIYHGAKKCLEFFISLAIPFPKSLLAIVPRKNAEKIAPLLIQAIERTERSEMDNAQFSSK
jgi:hypothetical protein